MGDGSGRERKVRERERAKWDLKGNLGYLVREVRDDVGGKEKERDRDRDRKRGTGSMAINICIKGRRKRFFV